jgi:hypothetical protein
MLPTTRHSVCPPHIGQSGGINGVGVVAWDGLVVVVLQRTTRGRIPQTGNISWDIVDIVPIQANPRVTTARHADANHQSLAPWIRFYSRPSRWQVYKVSDVDSITLAIKAGLRYGAYELYGHSWIPWGWGGGCVWLGLLTNGADTAICRRCSVYP